MKKFFRKENIINMFYFQTHQCEHHLPRVKCDIITQFFINSRLFFDKPFLLVSQQFTTCDTTLIFLCSCTRTVLRQEDRCALHCYLCYNPALLPSTEITHLYPAGGCQQYAHTRLGHLLNTHWKNAYLHISQYCTQYYTIIQTIC